MISSNLNFHQQANKKQAHNFGCLVQDPETHKVCKGVIKYYQLSL